MEAKQPERHREDFNALEPLIKGGIIGDVLDKFIPCMEMAVYYGLTQVTNALHLAPPATSSAPNIQIAGNFDDGSLFTLLMTDPDAPNPTQPSLREYVHWLVTDIPGGTDPSKGKEVIPYEEPNPPAGTHRYIFVLFKQSQAMAALDRVTRSNFSTKQFALEHGLGLPVAAVYFRASQGMEEA